jgi:hypothetical protein
MLSPASLVLVCLLPTPRDFEIAHLLGWYRIPVVAVDYLALYRSSRFGEEGAQIQYVAEVKGHVLTTRLELLRDEPDHPRAHEEYFKIQIGGLEKTLHPVKAENWRRITFLYTTGEYLLNAKTVIDLVVQGEERPLLWLSLRERAVNGQQYKVDLPGLDVDPQVLLALLGIKELQSDYRTDTSLEDSY